MLPGTRQTQQEGKKSPHPCTPSQTHMCEAQPASCLSLALTAAVTGTAGTSIPGIIGGTIPGICRYKDQRSMLESGRASHTSLSEVVP